MARVRIVMEYLVERLQALEPQLEISSTF